MGDRTTDFHGPFWVLNQNIYKDFQVFLAIHTNFRDWITRTLLWKFTCVHSCIKVHVLTLYQKKVGKFRYNPLHIMTKILKCDCELTKTDVFPKETNQARLQLDRPELGVTFWIPGRSLEGWGRPQVWRTSVSGHRSRTPSCITRKGAVWWSPSARSCLQLPDQVLMYEWRFCISLSPVGCFDFFFEGIGHKSFLYCIFYRLRNSQQCDYLSGTSAGILAQNTR
jgi:hypothetical protein